MCYSLTEARYATDTDIHTTTHRVTYLLEDRVNVCQSLGIVLLLLDFALSFLTSRVNAIKEKNVTHKRQVSRLCYGHMHSMLLSVQTVARGAC